MSDDNLTNSDFNGLIRTITLENLEIWLEDIIIITYKSLWGASQHLLQWVFVSSLKLMFKLGLHLSAKKVNINTKTKLGIIKPKHVTFMT